MKARHTHTVVLTLFTLSGRKGTRQVLPAVLPAPSKHTVLHMPGQIQCEAYNLCKRRNAATRQGCCSASGKNLGGVSQRRCQATVNIPVNNPVHTAVNKLVKYASRGSRFGTGVQSPQPQHTATRWQNHVMKFKNGHSTSQERRVYRCAVLQQGRYAAVQDCATSPPTCS